MFRQHRGILILLVLSSLALMGLSGPQQENDQGIGAKPEFWLVLLLIVIVLAVLLWWGLRNRNRPGVGVAASHPAPPVHHAEPEPKSIPAPKPALEPESPPEPEPEPAPEPEPVPESTEPDDLTVVEGIGPKTSSVLNEAGISTYAKLAETAVEKLQQIKLDAGLRLGDPTTWPEQAALAAKGDWEALETLQDSLKGGRRVN